MGKSNNIPTDKIRLALQWREDVESGEMIEARNYDKTYMGFGEVSQKELDAICKAINVFYAEMGSRLRIHNSMGELRPGKTLD